MIGPDGLIGRRDRDEVARITDVKSNGRTVRVYVGNDFLGVGRVTVEWSLTLGSNEVRPVDVHWSGQRFAAEESMRHAEEMISALRVSLDVARELDSLTFDGWYEPDEQITRGLVVGRPDYMLCAYLVLVGERPLYERLYHADQVTESQREHGVRSLADLRADALAKVLARTEVVG